MATSIEESTNCPSCLKTMRAPILQCLQGHSLCGVCSRNQRTCTICSSPMTIVRNLQLEKILDKVHLGKLKVECTYADKGCKFAPNIANLEHHVKECRFREFMCEGKLYCNWRCPWKGSFNEILPHFQASHVLHSDWSYKSDCKVDMDLRINEKTLKIIDFSNSSQVFWYKHKVDIHKKKCYWLFQCVGTSEYAANYFYEFEIYLGKIRKLKVTEICYGDSEDVELIFETERCVCVSFKTICSFMEKGSLSFRFRIMKYREPSFTVHVPDFHMNQMSFESPSHPRSRANSLGFRNYTSIGVKTTPVQSNPKANPQIGKRNRNNKST